MTNSNSKKQNVFKEHDSKGKSGLEGNLAGALCYLVWAITGVIFLIMEKDNSFVRFHALQSIITSMALFVITIILGIIPIIGWIISLLLTPVILLLWLFMMWKAYQGERFKLPFVGKFVEKQVDS